MENKAPELSIICEFSQNDTPALYTLINILISILMNILCDWKSCFLAKQTSCKNIKREINLSLD